MPRSIDQYGFYICLPLLVSKVVLLFLFGGRQQNVEEIEVPVPEAQVVSAHFLPVDMDQFELDLHLLDRQEYELSQRLGGTQDEVVRECLKQELLVLNTMLRYCERSIRELKEEVNAILPGHSAGLGWIRQMQHQLNSRSNAIRNLKDELFLREFQCEELEAVLEEADADVVRGQMLQRFNDVRPHRRPTSLPNQLV